ncbi:MAG: ABC-type transport system involved in multi-copper enzyme maturation permease subunit [Oleispira sp.]|jgi:ABC-type transport system involved in multi-copper enzyme maturation permease subunit
MSTRLTMQFLSKSILRSTWLMAQQELQASFASKRGLFVSIIFILIWTLLLFYPIRYAAEALHSPETNSLMLSALAMIGLDPLKDWKLAEFAIYWIVALFLFPASSLLMATDQLITERNRGGLRFLTLRCGRGQIFFGRFIGHLLIQTCLIVMTLVITYLLLLFNDTQRWLEGLMIMPLLLLNLVLVVCPFIALMSLLSVLMNSVRMASFMAVIILLMGGLMVNLAASYLPFLTLLNDWIPGAQVAEMAQLSPTAALLTLWNPAMQTLGFLVVGYGLFKRQAI